MKLVFALLRHARARIDLQNTIVCISSFFHGSTLLLWACRGNWVNLFLTRFRGNDCIECLAIRWDFDRNRDTFPRNWDHKDCSWFSSYGGLDQKCLNGEFGALVRDTRSHIVNERVECAGFLDLRNVYNRDFGLCRNRILLENHEFKLLSAS